MSALLDIRFSDLVRTAEREGASDIHFAPGVRAMMRVDGELQVLASPEFSAEEIDAISQSVFSPSQLLAITSGFEISTTKRVEDPQVTLRVHGLKTSHGVALAVRLLHRRIPTIDELRLPPVVASFGRKTHGLIVFCGPTGSGKSTTLAALVGEVNRTQARRIITIEDPIEYRHVSERSLVTQREIGRDATSFDSALTGALRADPDVIVVGEMRDPATIQAALTAAETGHLVLTTLHSASAVQAVDRMLDSVREQDRGLVRSQLAACLTAIVCQRLLPCAHGRGRRPAAEVLVANDGIRAMIRDGRTHLIENAIATGRNAGMQLFAQHVQELIAAGEVT